MRRTIFTESPDTLQAERQLVAGSLNALFLVLCVVCHHLCAYIKFWVKQFGMSERE